MHSCVVAGGFGAIAAFSGNAQMQCWCSQARLSAALGPP
jgi:hypothetical protein